MPSAPWSPPWPPNLNVLLVGWALLEGMGAALIMPAVVALVAANFPPEKRSAAYGLIAAAAAVAVAVGPLIGGAVSTFGSWRYVFMGEVVIAGIVLVAMRRLADDPTPPPARLDVVGALLTIGGLGSVVFGILRSSEWSWVTPPPGAPAILGVSLVAWLVGAGLLLLWAFVVWETRVAGRGGEPLVRLDIFANRQLVGGLVMFAAQCIVTAGVFFALPLFLSVVLELTPLETGLRLVPLSLALLASAVGVPKLFPGTSPRRVVRVGLGLVLLGIVVLIVGIDPGATAGVVTVPLLAMGLGLGALASQLGAVTVSAVAPERSAEVGGLQNTATNLGSSLGTALVGSVLISTLSISVLTGITQDPAVPDSVKTRVSTSLTGSVPFLSDTALVDGLRAAQVPAPVADRIVAANSAARLDALRTALALTALLTLLALFVTSQLPTQPTQEASSGPDPGAGPSPGGP